MAKILRLFWAVNLPRELKTVLGQLQERLKGAGSGARWVNADAQHITLKFLGDTDAGLLDRLVGEVSGRLSNIKSFELDVEGLGFFPGPANPRVVWAGLSCGVGLLAELAGAVESAMADCGFPRETRRYTPHLTLARIKSPDISELVVRVRQESATAGKLGSFKVISADLMKSDLTPRGPVYTLLSSVKLR